MSYILDALNKSDAERQREHAPNLKSIHRAPRSPGRRRYDLWQALIVVLVLANAVLLFVWLYPGAREEVRERAGRPEVQTATESVAAQASEVSSVPKRQSSPAPSEVVAPPLVIAPAAPPITRDSAADTPPATVARPASVIEPDTTGEVIVPAPTGREVPAIEPATLPDILQLPEEVQRQIPPLSFASHIYSSDPRSRLVSINGRLSREGDRVGDNLTLLSITEEGVVLEFGNYRFRMSILRDWSSE